MSFTKKGAIQLSMTFIVMLIIAIVVFMLSLAFLGDFFSQATELKGSLDEQTKTQIETLLAGNARVAIPIDTRDIKRGDSTSFGIGIKNTDATKEHFLVQLRDEQPGSFIPTSNPHQETYNVYCVEGVCTVEGYSGDGYSGDVAFTYQIGRNGQLQLPVNQNDVVLLAVGVERQAPRGHYIINVDVCSDDAEYTYGENCNSDNLYARTVLKVHLLVS